MKNFDEFRRIIEEMSIEAEQHHKMFPEDEEFYGRYASLEKVAMMLRSEAFYGIVKEAYLGKEDEN